jgi:hypothetical protein
VYQPDPVALAPALHYHLTPWTLACCIVVLQGQLLPRLEDESPRAIIKALTFFAKLGSGHVDMFEMVGPELLRVLLRSGWLAAANM